MQKKKLKFISITLVALEEEKGRRRRRIGGGEHKVSTLDK